MGWGLRAMRRSLRATDCFTCTPAVSRTLIERFPAMRVCNGTRGRRSTAGPACGRSGRCRRLRDVSVSHSRVERVPGESVGDAGRALALTLALRGAAGGFRGKSRRVVAVSVVLSTAALGGSFRAASAFDFGLGLAATAVVRLVSAVRGAVVGVEGRCSG
jgi:hypothetical protein